ncbi:MAG: ribokinase [Lachnospiraceae bacterium]|nr:ribokinase [Lachnospiraceae bacterium]
MKRVVVAGSLNYDMFLGLREMPVIGETATAVSSDSAPGGKGANQAVQSARLGVPTTMIGCIGKDWGGQKCKESLAGSGVDVCSLKISETEETGKGIVNVLPDGRVFSVICRGANYALTGEDILRVENKIAEADLLILQLEVPMDVVSAAVETAKRHGTEILLNAAPAAALEDSLIRDCDYFVVNEVECSFYAGRKIDSVEKAKAALAELTQKYGNCWVCTLGGDGAVIARKDRMEYIPAAKTEVVETTGAGDSFIGGFAYGILNGMDLFDAGLFASYCSAFTISGVGAQDSMPTRAQIRERFHI